ncbi:MAG: phenylalanine--tRNA ligase subunit beta, partial [Candidatus Solibacter usitatus]|nr:phenylalanine--tRNA ligase subunit beta [Candidatus Solibacter usitatus]
CLLPGVAVRPDTARPFEHPARAAEVFWRNERVGRLAELHPSLLTGRAALLDLDLQKILELRPSQKKYTPLRRFPESQFDLSVIAASRELMGDLQNKLTGFAGELLDHIEFVRVYSGPPLAENTKSVSFRLTVAAPDRTLSSDEVGAIRTRIIDGMRLLGYELRV